MDRDAWTRPGRFTVNVNRPPLVAGITVASRKTIGVPLKRAITFAMGGTPPAAACVDAFHMPNSRWWHVAHFSEPTKSSRCTTGSTNAVVGAGRFSSSPRAAGRGLQTISTAATTISATTTSNEEASLGPYIPTEAEAGAGPTRIIGWTAVLIVIGSVLVGYIAFASFLVDQLVWISVLLALLLLAIVLVDEFIGGTLRDQCFALFALRNFRMIDQGLHAMTGVQASEPALRQWLATRANLSA